MKTYPEDINTSFPEENVFQEYINEPESGCVAYQR